MKKLHMKTLTMLAAASVLGAGCADEVVINKPVVAAASKPSDGIKTKATKVDTRNLDAAEREYASQVADDPKDPTARVNLGVIKERKWDLDGALKEYQEAFKLDPRGLSSTISISRVLTALGKGEMAEKFLLAAKKANGDLPVVLNGLSSVARARKKYPEAIEYAKKVLLRDQNNIDALNNIALVYLDQGKFESAELYAQTAITRAGEKNASTLYVTLGMIQYKRNEVQRALAQFNKALSLDLNNAVARENVGLIALAYRDYALANTQLEQAIGLGQTTKEVMAGRCYALEGLKSGPEAATCFSQLTARLSPKDPELPGLLYAMGNVHMNLTRNRDEAIKAYERYADTKENLSKSDRVFELIKTLKLQQSAPPTAEEAGEPAKTADTPAEKPAEKTEQEGGQAKKEVEESSKPKAEVKKPGSANSRVVKKPKKQRA